MRVFGKALSKQKIHEDTGINTRIPGERKQKKKKMKKKIEGKGNIVYQLLMIKNKTKPFKTIRIYCNKNMMK